MHRAVVDPLDLKVGQDRRGSSCLGSETLHVEDGREEHRLGSGERPNVAGLLGHDVGKFRAHDVGALCNIKAVSEGTGRKVAQGAPRREKRA